MDPTVPDAVDAWAASGAMALTGHPDRTGLGPPAPLVPRLGDAAGVLRRRSAELGDAVDIDPLVVLVERAAASGLWRRGRTSCGGGSRLLPTADGWLAVSLPRPEDVELVPAWLALDRAPDDHWAAVADAVERRPTDSLVAAGAELGLAVGGLPAAPAPDPETGLAGLPVRAGHCGAAAPTGSLAEVVVADLSSLWAGPLCGSLLRDAGAGVVKVESASRPDGARLGDPAFFDLLNAGKRSVAIDLATSDGADTLRDLLMRVDVVIEASRPRALEQIGIDARQLVAAGGPRIWLSVTAHGREGPGRMRVGFGDDAAVSGGLVAWDDDGPHFCADAVADPATGLVAAAVVLEALAAGGRWLLDVSMSQVARHLAGPTLPVPEGVEARPPTQRPPRGVAPALGADTDDVLAGLRSAP